MVSVTSILRCVAIFRDECPNVGVTRRLRNVMSTQEKPKFARTALNPTVLLALQRQQWSARRVDASEHRAGRRELSRLQQALESAALRVVFFA